MPLPSRSVYLGRASPPSSCRLSENTFLGAQSCGLEVGRHAKLRDPRPNNGRRKQVGGTRAQLQRGGGVDVQRVEEIRAERHPPPVGKREPFLETEIEHVECRQMQ